MKKLNEIIEMAKAGKLITLEERRYVRSFVSGRDVYAPANCLIMDEIYELFPDEYVEGRKLQHLEFFGEL